MSEEIKRNLHKIMTRLYEASNIERYRERKLYKVMSRLYGVKYRLRPKEEGGKLLSEEQLKYLLGILQKRLDPEKRSERALDGLILDFGESKRREEEYKRKRESMGRLERFGYKTIKDLKNRCNLLKEIGGKPLGIGMLALGLMSLPLFTTATMLKIAPYIDKNVAPPVNSILNIIFGIGIFFSPFIISFEIYDYKERKREKRMLLEEYGILLANGELTMIDEQKFNELVEKYQKGQN